MARRENENTGERFASDQSTVTLPRNFPDLPNTNHAFRFFPTPGKTERDYNHRQYTSFEHTSSFLYMSERKQVGFLNF